MKQNQELPNADFANLFSLIDWLEGASMHHLAYVTEEIQKESHMLRIIKNSTIALRGQTIELSKYDDNSLRHVWECIAMLSEAEEKMGYEPNLSAALLLSVNVRLEEFVDSEDTEALKKILFEFCHELRDMYNSDDNDDELDTSRCYDYLKNLSIECKCEETFDDECDIVHTAFIIKELSSYSLSLLKFTKSLK